jgi:peptide deformylase
MQLENMLMLGDPGLHKVSEKISREELSDVEQWSSGLISIILQVRSKYGFGRAVAAPQMGIFKRLVCLYIDEPVTMINPELSNLSDEMIGLWDDCMSFPNLLVRVKRHKRCTLKFYDLDWKQHTWELEDNMSELLQHEVDHLDGILATQRAVGERALKWRS